MLRTALFALFSAALVQSADAAAASNAGGHAGLALAGVVASYSPLLSANDRYVMGLLLNGNQHFAYAKGKKIDVAAKSIVCRAGDVDITARSCVLTFGAKTVTITGRASNELYATLIEAGVPSDGAAGTIYEAVNGLACAIDPNGVKQNDGGGASCSFTPGP